MMTQQDFAMRSIDLIIIVVTIGTLLLVLYRGMLHTKLVPSSGRILIILGILLIMLVHVVDFILSTIQSSPIDASQPHILSDVIPPQIHWLLSRIAFSMLAVGAVLAIYQRKREEDAISKTSQLIDAAEDSIKQSEARFRYLVETTSNSIYCYEFDPPMPISLTIDEQVRRSYDAVLAECNQSFARDLEAERPSQIIGSRMGMLDSTKDLDAHYQYFKSFIEGDYRLTDYELIYKGPSGDDRALEVSLTGFVRDGYLHKMWGAERDILDIRRTRAALQRRQRFQEQLADISSRLVVSADSDADSELQYCMRKVCRYIGADRTTLIWLDKDSDTANTDYYWNELDATPPVAAPMAQFPTLFRSVLTGEVVRIDDIDEMLQEEKADQEVLRNIGVLSGIAVPLLIAGEIVGASTYSHVQQKRVWTDQDVLELRVFADLFANYVQRLKSYRQLDQALTDLQAAKDRLQAENVYLQHEINVNHGFDEIVGQSPSIMHCLRKVEQVAATVTPVLILGETGTGKELVARAIHERSQSGQHPLVKVNCAALPANLIESELFGYEKGAFTGADGSKRGRFDLAHGSTLFLDEIGEIPVDLQPKLLRVLQEGEFERLGGTETVRVDVRIVAATNRDLSIAVDNGEFRSDLYYRVNTFPIELPALRHRDGDVRLLAEYFVRQHSQRLGRDVSAISAMAMEQLEAYHWPGNIRELESVIQRALISSDSSVLSLAEPLKAVREEPPAAQRRSMVGGIGDLRSVEREHIVSTLQEAGWKISGRSGAASRLGIPPSTLRSKMKKLAIVRPH